MLWLEKFENASNDRKMTHSFNSDTKEIKVLFAPTQRQLPRLLNCPVALNWEVSFFHPKEGDWNTNATHADGMRFNSMDGSRGRGSKTIPSIFTVIPGVQPLICICVNKDSVHALFCIISNQVNILKLNIPEWSYTNKNSLTSPWLSSPNPTDRCYTLKCSSQEKISSRWRRKGNCIHLLCSE